jgi:hypothetical protein
MGRPAVWVTKSMGTTTFWTPDPPGVEVVVVGAAGAVDEDGAGRVVVVGTDAVAGSTEVDGPGAADSTPSPVTT